MSDTRLTVLFIMPSLKRGGAEVQVVELVNGLDSTRFSKHLFTFEPGLDLLDRLDQSTVSFQHWPRMNRYDYRSITQIARIIDERCVDIVHCTLQMALLRGWMGVRLSKRKPKLVVTLHTTVVLSKKAELLNRTLMQWLMRSCEKVVCVCRSQEEHWIAQYPFLHGRTLVIYNGVDPGHFSPEHSRLAGADLRRQHRVPSDAFVFCCIAGFRKEKNHRCLIEAFTQATEHRKNVFLLLAGDGAYRGEIQQLVEQYHISERVVFLGNISDVRPVLAASDSSVLASIAQETFSIAMLESLSMQVPMIATNVGGLREAIISGETGILIEPGSVESLADAMAHMLDHTEACQQMGSAGRELVLAQFSQRKSIEATSALLTSLG